MSGQEPIMRGCEFKFRCKRAWASLEVPENYPDGVRYCTTCMRDVFLVETDLDLKKAVLKNYCVAIPLKMQISAMEGSMVKRIKEGHLVGHVVLKAAMISPLKGIWP